MGKRPPAAATYLLGEKKLGKNRDTTQKPGPPSPRIFYPTMIRVNYYITAAQTMISLDCCCCGLIDSLIWRRTEPLLVAWLWWTDCSVWKNKWSWLILFSNAKSHAWNINCKLNIAGTPAWCTIKLVQFSRYISKEQLHVTNKLIHIYHMQLIRLFISKGSAPVDAKPISVDVHKWLEEIEWLSVPKFTANLLCICLSTYLWYI